MKKANVFIKFALVVLIVLSFVRIVDSSDKLVQAIDTAEEVQKVLDEKKQTVDRLKIKLDREVDREYIIEIARENGYRLPEEIIFNNDLPK